ncbi:MAG: ATP-binding protein [Thermoanaerobacterales bacterium]|nr:ATP-binding protein [Thermoanaerobacterales bacterium]
MSFLDELGYVQFDAAGSDHLFQLIAKAYEHRSLIVTSNLDFRLGTAVQPTGDRCCVSRQTASSRPRHHP